MRMHGFPISEEQQQVGVKDCNPFEAGKFLENIEMETLRWDSIDVQL